MTACWLDLFEHPGFTGLRRRLHGPADYMGMLGGSPRLMSSFGSLIVGGDAHVLFFKNHEIQRTAYWIKPGVRVARFEGVSNYDSVRIYPRAPMPGDPGFDRYLQTIYNS